MYGLDSTASGKGLVAEFCDSCYKYLASSEAEKFLNEVTISIQ